MGQHRTDQEMRVGLAAGALAAAACLTMLALRFADAPPTVLDARLRRRIRQAAGARGRQVARVTSIPGYPAFYFPATALLMAWLRRRGATGAQALAIASIGGW